MVTNLFPDFLVDPQQYERSERFWEDLWGRVAPSERERFQWRSPWLGTGSPGVKDGNPIFSAYSPVLGRGVRVIQEEPTGSRLDIRAWLDTFGGDITDPDSIVELVIVCALSDVSSRFALDLMSPWVSGRSISFRSNAARLLLPSDSEAPRRKSKSLDFAA